MNSSWDAIWEVESKLYDDSYIAEVKIPFNQLYFINGSKSWRFNIYRSDTQSLEHSSWAKIPQEQRIGDLGFMGKMNFEKPLGESKKPVSFIPYINGSIGKDFSQEKKLNNFDYGLDIKIPIGNSINVDLTLNPDFSQVEVDDQLVNLSQWELRLPEKRQFFTQNSDLFTDFGQERDAEPFFSRRIGISKDYEGNTVENKIINKSGLEDEDKEDIKRLAKLSVDWIALSFVNDASDVNQAREVLSQEDSDIKLIAKIERLEALKQLYWIIKASDGIMVARGDLALQSGPGELTGLQKNIIKQTVKGKKVAITATQMMESTVSYTHLTLPTNREV